MVEKFAAEVLKLNKIVDLKAELFGVEKQYSDGMISESHYSFHRIMEAVLKKIASGSCSHEPSRAKLLLVTGQTIGYLE